MYAISRFDYTRLQELSYARLRGHDRLLLIVLGVAATTRGAEAWIELPFFQFQPSEFGKVLLVLALAGFLVDRMRLMGRQTTARVLLLGLIPAMLVMAQPDLGSALVYVVGIFALLFVAGARGATSPRSGAVRSPSRSCCSARPALGVEVLQPYQKDRLTAFL